MHINHSNPKRHLCCQVKKVLGIYIQYNCPASLLFTYPCGSCFWELPLLSSFFLK